MIRTEASGEHVCECNECGETAYAGTLEFRPFVADLKANGWKITKDDEADEWLHTCPECQD